MAGYFVPPIKVAYYLIKQALEKSNSLPIKVSHEGEFSEIGEEEGGPYLIAYSAPEGQAQTIASMIAPLQEMSLFWGFDYRVVYGKDVSGNLTAEIRLAYPCFGWEKEAENPIELSQALDMEYNEDGTEQANLVMGRAGGASEDVSVEEGFYAKETPRLEATANMPAVSEHTNSKDENYFIKAILKATVIGQEATQAFPLTTIVLTMPMFGTPSIFDLVEGENYQFVIPTAGGDIAQNNPRFPEGYPDEVPSENDLWQLTRIDSDVPDEGIPLMKLTLVRPPRKKVIDGENFQKTNPPPEYEEET